MPKKIDRDVILRSYVLRRQGKSLDAILDYLHEQFEGRLPDRSTISRYLKRFESELPEELAEDAPFKWSEMKEVPWEGSRAVMGAYAHYVANDGPSIVEPFTNRDAKWIYRVSQAMWLEGHISPRGSSEVVFNEDFDVFAHNKWRATGEITALYEVPSLPTRVDILLIAREYSVREIHSILFSVEFDTSDLDLWLAFLPWTSSIQLLKYHTARDAYGGFERILWHSEDIKWPNLIDPKPAAFLKENSPVEIPEPKPLNEEDKALVFALDGLLPSQTGIIALWLEAASKNPELWEREIDLWYLEFLRRMHLARLQNNENDSFKNHDLLLGQI